MKKKIISLVTWFCDSKTRSISGILEIIQNVAHNETTMLLVTHEMIFAKEVSDQVCFLEDGLIVEKGDTKQIFTAPENERTESFIQGIKY